MTHVVANYAGSAGLALSELRPPLPMEGISRTPVEDSCPWRAFLGGCAMAGQEEGRRRRWVGGWDGLLTKTRTHTLLVVGIKI